MRIRSQEDYDKAYKWSVEDPEDFWAGIASNFDWRQKWETVLQYDFEKADFKWFEGGRLNITENCLDRHMAENPTRTAIIWEPNDPDDPVRKLTYKELYEEVCRAGNALKAHGIKKGDRVCFYMPMVPELAIGILACARIGAIHSVVFAGFSAQALADRINDADCKMVICSDFNRRGKKNIPVKQVVDDALDKGCPSVETVLVYRHTGEGIQMKEGRDLWWHEEVPMRATDCHAEIMDAEDTLFILYTSGSTGKPKGVVHSCAGYMIYTTYTFMNVFQYEPDDIYWCTADIGWITGHSYIIYGPLAAGATTLMFEGVPTWPDPGRFWQVCEKHKVNQFYTAPTAIRALEKEGKKWVEKYDLSSLRVLGTVGEPINDEAWYWYRDAVGKGKLPVIDTWWQTETGGIMITPLPGITDLRPSYATYPMPGIQPALVDKDGNEIEQAGTEGFLCIKFPWPSILRTTWGNHQRCKETYFEQVWGMYFTGDSAKRDEEGRYRIIGRVDDVINVSGHRIGTAEIEDAVCNHDAIVEAAVVGYPHEIKGQGIFAFVVLEKDIADEKAFKEDVRELVRMEIGPIAKPDEIVIVPGLPKTRSGKIMRRILRKIAADREDELGDTSTLVNPEIVAIIAAKAGV